jgi:hypothetical protein
MANVKFSQFNLETSLSATGFLVGYDGVNNTRLTKASLESSLDLANLSGTIDLSTQVSGTIDLAAQVSGVLPILNGGTGETTAQAAIDSLTNVPASSNGDVLTSDGTNVSLQNPSNNPYVPIVAMTTCIWGNTTNPFFNFTPNNWVTVPFDTTQFSETTFPTNSFVPATVFNSSTDTYFKFKTASYGKLYKIEVTLHFYDQTSNFDLKGAVFVRNTSTLHEMVIDDRSVETSDDKMWYGYTFFVPVVGQDEIQVRVNNSASAPGAFPSLSDNGYNRITISLIN